MLEKAVANQFQKFKGKIERNQFRTKVQEVENLGIDIPPNTFKVEFNNKVYLVGEAVSEEKKLNTTYLKKSIEHLISIYLSIAKFVDKTGITNLSLAVGTPLNIYKNKQLKEEYEQYIQGNGIISIKVNDKLIYFRINKVLCLPEGTGPIYTDIDKYKTVRLL